METFLRVLHTFTWAPSVPDGTMKVVSITVSHYCEKVRWALSTSSLRYVEDNHAPALHIMPVVKVTKNPRERGTPLLVLPDGRYILDSTYILLYLCDTYPDELGFLYPPALRAEALSLEEEFDEGLGVEARRLMYHLLFKHLKHKNIAQAMTYNAPFIERLMLPRMLPVVQQRMLRFYDVNDETVQRSRPIIREAFARASELLSKDGGRRYLLGGDGLTAADITFAALAQVLLGTPQTANLLPVGLDSVAEYVSFRDELRQTRAGQHVLRLYAEERLQGDSSQCVEIRTVPRDRLLWTLVAAAGGAAVAVIIFGLHYSSVL